MVALTLSSLASVLYVVARANSRTVPVGNTVGASQVSASQRYEQPRTANQSAPSCAPRQPCPNQVVLESPGGSAPRVPGAEAPADATPVTSDDTRREPSAAPEASGFTGRYRTVSTRSGSFRGSVVVTNGGRSPSSWHVDLGFPPGVQLTWTSGGAYTQAGQTATLTWPLLMDPGSTLTLEFEASKTGQNLVDFVPRSCVVNGSRCV